MTQTPVKTPDIAPADTPADSAVDAAQSTAYPIILAVSFCHLLNDMMQSLFPALYPILQKEYGLTFGQIGLLTLTFQVTASVLQPVIGIITDKRPMPYSTAIGMGFTLVGLILLSAANRYPLLLLAAGLVGLGSAVFHPESSRVARLASGGKHGLAQSLFQVGGNLGSSIGPLLAAFIVVDRGQGSIRGFALFALLAMIILWQVGNWYRAHRARVGSRASAVRTVPIPPQKVIVSLVVLALLVFTKYIYMASITNYYTFYLIQKFHVTVQQSQLLLFLFLGGIALGTIAGGPLGDRFGSKTVIWFSILGILPFTLALPYASLTVTAALTVIIGATLASAFPAIVVLAQELVPGKVGMIGGIFFGFAFGMAGIAAAALGALADSRGIEFVYHACSFLPLLGLLAVFLPSLKELRATAPA